MIVFYRVVKGKTEYVALAKEAPFVMENPCPIREPGELWFESGETPFEALHNLKNSLPNVKEWRIN